MIRALFITSLLCVAACSDTVDVGSQATNDTGVGDDTGESDAGNDSGETDAGEDTGDSGDGCTDEGCGAGQICEDGACVAGCRTNEDCASPDGPQVCFESRCVGCRDDLDCTLETVCTDDECVEGCRDDEGCREGRICGDAGVCVEGCRDDANCADGLICQEEACVEGCRDDAGCPLGTVCDDNACVEGCNDDSRCERGTICRDDACVEGCRDDDACDRGSICIDDGCASGCRDDAGCDADLLCLEDACVIIGVGCRTDEHCDEGDVCNQDTLRCEAGEQPCTPDAFEPNNEEGNPTGLGEEPTRAGICPGDVDWFFFTMQDGDELELDLSFNTDAGSLEAVLRLSEQDLTRSRAVEGGAQLTYTARGAGRYTLRVAATEPDARLSYAIARTITEPQMCVDTQVFRDLDEDGFGDDDDDRLVCLDEGEDSPGFVRDGGDCGPEDPLRYPGAEGICGDRVDDDCEGGDEACPESRDALADPDWDCSGDPPSSVYAYARFDDGGGYFQDAGCFYFFEGVPGEFYVKRNLRRANNSPSCTQFSGCTCPSLNGWPSYDKRMYAFTLQGEVDACPDIWLQDHAREDALLMVSNACRKYLLQLHLPSPQVPAEIGFITGNIDNLRQRLELYPRVEVACVQDRPHRNLPYQSLLVGDIVLNENFQGQ